MLSPEGLVSTDWCSSIEDHKQNTHWPNKYQHNSDRSSESNPFKQTTQDFPDLNFLTRRWRCSSGVSRVRRYSDGGDDFRYLSPPSLRVCTFRLRVSIVDVVVDPNPLFRISNEKSWVPFNPMNFFNEWFGVYFRRVTVLEKVFYEILLYRAWCVF